MSDDLVEVAQRAEEEGAPVAPKRVSLRIPIEIRALSPITHGGDEKAGNTSLVRRQRILDKAGSIHEVPVLSGNSLRGQLRRIAARDLAERCGVVRMPASLFHLLFSGGSIHKGEVKHAHDAAMASDVRRLLPQLAVFGAAYKAHILHGNLRCRFFLPVCAETQDITGVDGPPVAPMTEFQFFTRRGQVDQDLVTERAEDEVDTSMIFEAEAITAGTRMVGGVELDRGLEVDASMLGMTLWKWAAKGTVGGNAAKGCGRVEVTFGEALPPEDAYVAHMAENRKEQRAWLREHGATLGAD